MNRLFGVNWTARKVLYLFFAVSFLLNVVAMMGIAPKISSLTTDISRTETIRSAYNQLFIHLLNTETGTRGYVIAGTEDYLEPYYSGQRGASASIDRLKNYPRTKAQGEFIDRILPLAEKKLRLATDSVNARRFNGNDAAEQFLVSNPGKKVMDDFRKEVGTFDESEERRLREMHETADKLSYAETFCFLFAAISFITLIVLLTTGPSPPRPAPSGVFPWRDF